MAEIAAGAGGEAQAVRQGAQRLRIGVTGHRLARLHEAGADLSALAATCSDVLARLRAPLAEAPPFHLVTGLAEGADSIVADCAVVAGWRIDAVLPFPREDYALDFPEGAPRRAHAARVDVAEAVFEFPGSGAAENDRGRAYERAGRTVLAQSDILLAVWDGGPARGPGGAAQIVAEAVLRGIPVIQVDPAAPDGPTLLWDGLEEHDFGQQSVETVSRGGLDHLPRLIAGLTAPPAGEAFAESVHDGRSWSRMAFAYPLLLAVLGVRPWRAQPNSDVSRAAGHEAPAPPDPAQRRLVAWFEHADACALAAGRTFRSAYVTNFSLAALAVLISLSGLALPTTAKPFLALLELCTIGGVLALTHIGRRAHWHQRWLDQRHLAERLRCLVVASRLGELGLRRGHVAEGGWVSWVMRAAGRLTGLPSARVDAAYLGAVRASLLDLLQAQLTYLRLDARRMHTLEHRLHRLGAAFFATTAALCLGMFVFEVLQHLSGDAGMDRAARPLGTATLIGSAALPALGAAIYGIRMQGDFAGIAERDAGLAAKLETLRALVLADAPTFDLLSRRVRRTTELLTEDVSSWLHTYKARPLSLLG